MKRLLAAENRNKKSAEEKRPKKEMGLNANSANGHRIHIGPRGFERGLEPEKIMEAVKSTGELMFLMKWYVEISSFWKPSLVRKCYFINTFAVAVA